MTSLHADEAFLGHYHLDHDPFAARVPGFKFFPAQRKPVLGQLHHLARYSQLLLVVTGPHGSGKTLLRQALVASTNKQSVQSVIISARGAGDAASVLGSVAQSLGVAQLDVGTILGQIVQLALTGQEVYVLVDDAEQLDESALEALLALAAGAPEGRPHVFLFGEPSLIGGLEQLATEEELFHVIELAPYTEEETREYLAQRLEGAGQGIKLFSNEQINDIHEHSGGWPGIINQVARDALIEAMIASRSAVKRPSMGFKMPKKLVLALSGVVAVAVAAALLIPGRGKEPTTAPAQQSQLALGEGQPSAAKSNNGGPAVEFSGNTQALPLNGQPVVRGTLAEQAGSSDVDGEDTGAPAANQPNNPVSQSASRPPTVTTIAPPAGVSAGCGTGHSGAYRRGQGALASGHGQTRPQGRGKTGRKTRRGRRRSGHQLVHRPGRWQLRGADHRHQLRGHRQGLHPAGQRLPLLQENPARQAVVRGHLWQLRQPRRGTGGDQELARKGPGW
jgi:DamX protein